MRSAVLAVAALLVASCAVHRPAMPAPAAAAAPILDSRALAASWDAEHVSRPLPPLVRHRDVVAWLEQLSSPGDGLFATEEVGRSVEGRSINHVAFGRGPFHVLLWSQMHGDEPTATVALFDLFDYVRRHRNEPPVRMLLERLTVHAIPMLNPDGAERFQRRNAQGIDVNRDALLLQTPEGRALKTLRDRLNAPVGFNLHNQNWKTSAGKSGEPATISLLSVAFDAARSENAGRVRTKKICALIRDALEPLAPGRIARYDDEFEVRAFGDNITKWGTSVVLIETGGWPGTAPDRALVRLNFVALAAALEALATSEVDRADVRRYDSLPLNDSFTFYRLIQHATIVVGNGVQPYTGDVGLVASRTVTTAGGERQLHVMTRIDDVGDLRVFGALETIDARGLTLAPSFDASLEAGDEVQLPDWTDWTGNTIAVGQPGAMVLLRPSSGAKFRVERVFKADQRETGQ
ncbi:MAG: M14 family metallopeptidase [Bacteroidales bacterium]